MIDITHKQAMRWILESLDHRLPDTQWTALQVHLESCTDCRAYSGRLTTLERGLRRALKGSWSSVSGPADSTSERVVVHRRALLPWRRQVLATFIAMTSLLIFYLLGGFDRLFPSASDSAAIVPVAGQPAVPTGTPLPMVQAGEFHGVLAFDAITDDGRRALFLLNPASGPDAGPEQLVLVGVPETGAGEPSVLYNDRAPAWSPDGEWLAFLSDRSSQTGKEELFVTNVAGSRVVQLTDLADVVWEAPLSWSADGQWIALSGVRSDQGGQRWVYRVPIDTARQGGPVAVAGSRNGFSPEYAPYGDRLAYGITDGEKGGVVIDHIESGERVSTNWQKNDLGQPPAAGAAFDWSSDGTGLVYIAGQLTAAAEAGAGSAGAGSQVVAVSDLNYSISLFYDLLHNFQITQSRWSGAYHAVTWTPGGAVVYLEDLDDARANDQPGQTTSGCWTLQFRRLGLRGSDGEMRSLSALCVESGLDRSSWTPDGDWLVVVGRTAEEISAGSPRGIYAVNVPRLNENEVPRVVRLGSVRGAASMPRVRPLARRYNSPPAFDPRPVTGPDTSSASTPTLQGIVNQLLSRGSDRADSPINAESSPLPSNLSKAPGHLFFLHKQGNGSMIARMNPDGTGGRLLFATDGYNTCPSPAPNGRWIAFVSDMGSEAVQPSGKSPGVSNQTGLAQTQETPKAQFASDNAFQPTIGNAIYLVDADGGGMVAISSLDSLPESAPSPGFNAPIARYGCPSWSPDGRWLIYASESGLWGLDVQGALAGSAVPVWLSPQPVEHLSWR